MEGFLTLKTVFSALRVYVVLEGQQITCYEKLESNAGVRNPKRVRLTFSVKNASIVPSKALKHGLKLISSAKKTLAKFGCEDDEAVAAWTKHLIAASVLHVKELEAKARRQENWRVLNLDPKQRLSKTNISKSYKKLSLLHHPDRGGDASKFNELYSAYEAVIAIKEEEEKRLTWKSVTYEAVIEKGPGSIGLGLVVVEDKVRGLIVVQSVSKDIIIKGLSADADGEIRAEDALLQVSDDDCSRWPMSRIRARLSHVRVAVGAHVRFTFQRRLPPSNVTEPELQERFAEQNSSKWSLSAVDSPINISDTRRFMRDNEPEERPLLLGMDSFAAIVLDTTQGLAPGEAEDREHESERAVDLSLDQTLEVVELGAEDMSAEVNEEGDVDDIAHDDTAVPIEFDGELAELEGTQADTLAQLERGYEDIWLRVVKMTNSLENCLQTRKQPSIDEGGPKGVAAIAHSRRYLQEKYFTPSYTSAACAAAARHEAREARATALVEKVSTLLQSRPGVPVATRMD